MFQIKPHESFEDASRRAFEQHARAAPVALPIVSLSLAALIWWSPPSAWFVVFNVLGGLMLDIDRDFNFQLVQGLGLMSLPLYIFALTHRRKLPTKSAGE